MHAVLIWYNVVSCSRVSDVMGEAMVVCLMRASGVMGVGVCMLRASDGLDYEGIWCDVYI